MSFRDELRVLLTGDSRGLTKEMGKAQKKVSGFSSGMKKMGGMIAGAFAVSAMVVYSKGIMTAVGAQADLAARIGSTKSELDALELAFTLAGQSVQENEKQLDIFNRKLGELDSGVKGATDSFKKLGISQADMADKSLTDQLLLVRDRLAKIDLQAAAVSQKELFGKGGAKVMIGLKALEQAQAEIAEVNAALGITGDETVKIEELGDSFDITKKKLELIATVMLTNLAPAIEAVAEKLGYMAVKFGGAIKAAGSFFEAMGQSFVMDNQARGVFDIEGTGDRFDNYLKQLEQGRPSPRGGELPSGIGQAAASAAAAALKKEQEEVIQVNDEYAESLGDLASKLNEEATPASEKFFAGVKKLDDALAEGLGTDAYALGIKQLREEFEKTDPATLKAAKAAEELKKKLDDLKEEGASLASEMRSPFEVMNDSIAKYKMLLDEAVISQETFARAVMDARKAFEDSDPEIQRANQYAEQYKNEIHALEDQIRDMQELSGKGLLSKAAADQGIESLKEQIQEIEGARTAEKMQPWLDALKQYDEQMNEMKRTNDGELKIDPMEPIERKRIGEAGSTGFGGGAGALLAQSGLQAKSDQQKMVDEQKKASNLLQEIAANTRNMQGLAYV
jgi:hypothetical protein